MASTGERLIYDFGGRLKVEVIDQGGPNEHVVLRSVGPTFNTLSPLIVEHDSDYQLRVRLVGPVEDYDSEPDSDDGRDPQ